MKRRDIGETVCFRLHNTLFQLFRVLRNLTPIAGAHPKRHRKLRAFRCVVQKARAEGAMVLKMPFREVTRNFAYSKLMLGAYVVTLMTTRGDVPAPEQMSVEGC